jgi:hypothetical protein
MIYFLMLIFFATAPLIIFSATPNSSCGWRISRIFIATFIGYVLLNISVEVGNQNGWRDYQNCYNASRYGIDNYKTYEECKHHLIASEGLNNIFYLFIGWIPAGGYVGFFELWWRIKYRENIRKMGKQFKGKWFSNFVVVAAIPVWLFMMFIFLLGIFMKIYCFIDFSNDKC